MLKPDLHCPQCVIMVFVIFDSDGNYSNTVVMEEGDPLPEGFTKQQIPPGCFWDNEKVVAVLTE